MSSTGTTTAPVDAPVPVLPVTGDDAVDGAMGLLAELLADQDREHDRDQDPAGGGDAAVLTAVHEVLQRRLTVTAG